MFNLEYKYDHLVALLIPFRQENDRRKLVLHTDNVTVNTAQKYRVFSAENDLQLAMH
jgi:hypothetical protein